MSSYYKIKKMDDTTMNTTLPDYNTNDTTLPENDYIDIGDDNLNYQGTGTNYIDDPLNVSYLGTGTNYMDFDNIISSYTGAKDEMTGVNLPSYSNLRYYKKDDECDYRGKWGSDEMNIIDKCNQCVSNNGFYGEKQYFCDGSCISRYKQAVCPSTGLVATNLEQCKNPCYKTRPRTGFCNDDFDCDVKDECYKDKNFYKGIKGVCLRKENYKFIGVI